MASSCSSQKQALLACLADSPCMQQGNTIEQCMELDPDCRALRMALTTCKRGQLDMRKRIKGNMQTDHAPIKSDEAESTDEGDKGSRAA
eukprot:CAMPEP_0119322872 /NCGR_PEP_ID=MMETSP1333-20130426/59392_1 /TAXON_ID=418940 /ORGANISM="Scyphosphaera apsteinii, Strain RCC1455" /LENGTH=88 /DNA_ID=CAMNT_0007330207 /DNA_START=18 /DNA_END=284 /DNA_ORIENTATION=-